MFYQVPQPLTLLSATLENASSYRSFPHIRVITDACCRVPESRQHIPRHKARGKAACAYVLVHGTDIVAQGVRYLGECTIAEAEYQGILLGLDKASGFCRRDIEVWTDNEIIAGQLAGFYALRSGLVTPLFDRVKQLELRYQKVSYFHHSRGSLWARAADKLANDEYSRLHTG